MTDSAQEAWRALVTSEEHLRVFVENAPAGLAMFDRDMRYIAASARYAELYRLRITDLVGRLHTDVFPDIPERWKGVWRRCLAGAIERAKDDPFPRGDGSLDYVDWEIRPWRTAAGEIGGIVLLSEVVTDRRLAAEKLARSEERFRTLFDRAPIGMAELAGPDAKILRANEHLGAILGVDAFSLRGRPLLELVVPDDGEDLRDDLAAVRSRRTLRLERELRLPLERGRTATVSVTYAALEDADTIIVTFVERRGSATAEAERSSRGKPGGTDDERWAAMIRSSPLAMTIGSATTGLIVDVNPAFEQLTGYDRQEILGRTTDSLGIAVDPKRRRQLFEEASRHGSASLSGMRVRTKHGSERIVDLSFSIDESGGETRLVGIAHDVTDERRLAEALEAREQAVLAVFENAPLGLAFSLPSEGRFAAVNPRLCQLLGYSREELLAKGILDLTHPDDRTLSAEAMSRMASGAEREVALTKRYIRKDGSIIECDLRVASIPRKPGEPLQVVVGFTVLTERQRAERSAREAEQRWSATVEAAREAIVLTSAEDGLILDVNAAAERLTGFSREELRHQSARELGLSVSPVVSPGASEDSAPSSHGEVMIRRKDGQLRRCDVSTAALTLDGRAARVSVVTDITDRRAAEEALARSEERYRELVEHLVDPILSTDLEGMVTYVSPAVARFGYEPHDLIGTPAELLLRPEERFVAATVLAELREGRTPPAREGVILDRAGKPRPIRYAPRPVVRDGRIVGFTSILTDLTAQRAVEEQLRAAQRMEAVGRLAGGVAHDFNNLLTVILSYADIARSEIPATSPTQECLEEVVQAGKRAEGLTRQLLAFSRKQLIVLEPLSIEKVVGGVTSMLRRLIGEDIRLDVSTASDLPMVKAELGQLELVLMNLVINSRDAMPDGGVITIAARRTTLEGSLATALEMPPGAYVELSVRDDGTGMDEETRLRVFEPFFTTKGLGKGTGLGLSTVYGIVKQFGGGVEVRSKVGAGTTFRIYLPALKTVDVAPEPLPAHETRSAPPRGNEHVLVVEDEAAMRRVLRRILTNAGYRVIVCGTPSEALDACRSSGSEIDLVLTDVVMPEMNGRELARRLHELTPNVPVVFMSGYTDEALERLDVLSSNFLRKPFESEALRKVVRSALDQRA